VTRGGRHMKREDPERRCIATGESGPKEGLIRFVVGPDNSVFPDLAERLPGRGIWVSAARDAVELATKKRLFSRAAKTQVDVADDLLEQVDALLVTRLSHHLSLARKAGQGVAGFEKVKTLLAAEDVSVLFQASDGSEGQKRKLWTPEGARFFGCLTGEELGLAFGRDRVIHAAVKVGGLADLCMHDSVRLSGLRGLVVKDRRRPAPAIERFGQI